MAAELVSIPLDERVERTLVVAMGAEKVRLDVEGDSPPVPRRSGRRREAKRLAIRRPGEGDAAARRPLPKRLPQTEDAGGESWHGIVGVGNPVTVVCAGLIGKTLRLVADIDPHLSGRLVRTDLRAEPV